MIIKNILSSFEIDDQEIEKQVEQILGTDSEEDMLSGIDETVSSFEPGAILNGTIVNLIGDEVIIEVGLKSEGSVSKTEFDDLDQIQIGDTIEVMLEAVESDSGLVLLSKRKADRIRGWQRILENHSVGDTIDGKGQCLSGSDYRRR